MKYERLTDKDWHITKALDMRDDFPTKRAKLCKLWNLENKFEQGTLVDIQDIAKLFDKLFGSPCDYGMDGEEVIDVILANTDGNWCERNCVPNEYTLCWEEYIKAKLKEL